MGSILALDRRTHEAKGWRRFESYKFAVSQAIVPLALGEVGRVVQAMPLAFIEHKGQFVLVAVMAPMPGSNLFVAPGDGRWLGGYVPAALRVHPFVLAPQADGESYVLCIENEAESVVDVTGGVEPFFDSHGNLGPATKAAFDFLITLQRGREAAILATKPLAEAGLMRSWELAAQMGIADAKSNGLFRIDEEALNALPDDAFLRLRRNGALPLAFMQLISMGQLTTFIHLLKLREQLQANSARVAALPPDALDNVFGMAQEETLRFD